jgi:hypothetical protein
MLAPLAVLLLAAQPRVVFVYPAIQAYLDRAVSVPEKDRTELYYATVIEPHLRDCFSFGSYQPSHSDLVGMTSGNPAAWNAQEVRPDLKRLDASRGQIRAALQDGFARSAKALPGHVPATVCVLYYEPSNPVRERMNGVMAYTANQDIVDLYVAPVEGFRDWIAYNAAHEFHHAAWMHSNPHADVFAFSLLDYLVFEGRADRFASSVTGLTGAWTQALSPADACRWFEKVKPHLAEKGQLLPQVMFGGRGGEYPQWTGYTLGSGIVGAWLRRHPGAPPRAWTAMSPAQLFAESGYEPCR